MVEKCGDVAVEKKKKKMQSLMLLQGTPEVWQMAVVVVLVLLSFISSASCILASLSLSLSSINSELSYC